MVMEKSLGNVAKSYGSQDLVLGYSKYQGMQDWIEQTPEQIAFVTEELGKYGIRTSSPLYNVLEYPFDPILSLSSVGVPIKEQKIEMKCKAGGLNPKDLDLEKLLEFLIHKNEQTNHIFAKNVDVVAMKEIDNPKYNSKSVENLFTVFKTSIIANGFLGIGSDPSHSSFENLNPVFASNKSAPVCSSACCAFFGEIPPAIPTGFEVL